jgi:uncharacterized protein (TIGR02246 family)
MKRKSYLLLASGVLVVLTYGLLPGQDCDPPVKKLQGGKRPADEALIREQAADFVRAFNKGDAKSLAALWTPEGEYIDDDGATYRGRAAIQKVYGDFFAKNPKRKLDIKIESIRFVSSNSAIEEGYATSQVGNSVSTTRYSTLHVKENGKWLMAVVREWSSTESGLVQLDWLIGSWASNSKDGEVVNSTYSWDANKKFIRGRFTIKGKLMSLSGTQIIAKDPRSGQIRSWIFEAEGGFGEATWTFDGKRWLQDAAGVQGNGTEITATNIITPLGKDAFSWQSVDRTVNGDEVPNIPPVKVTRVK